MNALLLLAALLWLGMALVVRDNERRAPRLSRAGSPLGQPHVSVLVPARNEAANLNELLPRLRAQSYRNMDVHVLDDGSSDGTAFVVRRWQRGTRGRLQLRAGAPLPTGWTGKNWACQQLADEARGSILLFCDADVRPEPQAVAATVAMLQRTGAGAVSALPRQVLGSWLERALVPWIMHWAPWAMAPLAAVANRPEPQFVVANGQWLALTRAAYAASGGHAAVRGRHVDDMALGGRLKRAGQRLVPALAADLIAVRMYRGASETWAGLARTLYPLVGARLGGTVVLGTLWLAVLASWLLPLADPIAAVLWLGWAALGVAIARTFRMRGRDTLWLPLGAALLGPLLVVSTRNHRRQRVPWKGRVADGERFEALAAPAAAVHGAS